MLKLMFAPLLTLMLIPDVTPEKTVRAFVEAFNAHDWAALGKQVLGSKASNVPFPAEMPKLTVTLGDAKIAGDEATIEVDTEFPEPRGSSKFHGTVRLHQTDGNWRIVPATSIGSTRSVEPIAIFAMLATNPEIFAKAKNAAKRAADLSNVKQIALAVLQYAADHDDRLPPAKGFKAAVMPYIRDSRILAAPGAPKGAVSYFFEPRLSGVRMTTIPRPAETAMILEGTPSKTAYPWAGKTPLGYVDGHVKMVDASFILKARRIAIK